jgi:hypothetical protein
MNSLDDWKRRQETLAQVQAVDPALRLSKLKDLHLTRRMEDYANGKMVRLAGLPE